MEEGRTFAQVKIFRIKALPIAYNAENADFKTSARKISTLVIRILSLHNQTTTTPLEQDQLRREIESTDRQIDQLVYQLYGLTPEEIKIVEGSF